VGRHLSACPLSRLIARADARSVFSKTLFTPAGVDVYIRASTQDAKPQAMDTKVRADLLAKIVQAVKGNEDQGVAKLADGGFEVPGVV
jgi:hypothetical protein